MNKLSTAADTEVIPVVASTQCRFREAVFTIDARFISEEAIDLMIPEDLSKRFPTVWFHWGFDCSRMQNYLAIESDDEEGFLACKQYFHKMFHHNQGDKSIEQIMAN
jgi:hypothetical protein